MSNDLLNGGNGLSSLAPEIEDCCFAINLESLMNTDQSASDNKQVTTNSDDFVGVISLQSTTISDFHYGLIGGLNSIINCDKSSFINLRGTAMRIVHPRIVKITSSVIQKVDGDGINIQMVETSKEVIGA